MQSMRALAATTIGLTLFLQLAGARSDGPLQKVVANVVDSSGAYVYDLKASDFTVQENGVAKELAGFLPDSEDSISVGVLIDATLSMQQWGKWPAAIGAARAVLHLLRPKDEFQLMEFGPTMDVVQRFTSDQNKIEAYLREMYPSLRGTNVSGAVGDALKELKKPQNPRRGLIVITDVEDNEGGGIPALKASLHTEELPVYIFAVRPDGQTNFMAGGRGMRGMRGMPMPQSAPIDGTLKTVEAQDGRSLVLNVNQLQSDESALRIIRFMQTFATEVRGQYTLTYHSSIPEDEAWRRAIRIRTKSSDLTVRFRRE
jgi:VWFA-related protein